MSVELVSFTGDSGLADYAVSLAREMRKLTDVKVVTSEHVPDRFQRMGFEVVHAFRRTRHFPIDIWKFVAGVLRRRPKWLVLQGPLKWPLLDAILVWSLRGFGINVAITVHDVLPHYPGPFSRWTFPFFYRSGSKLITHSEAAKQALQTMGVRRPTLVVPHGIYDLFKLTDLSKDEARRMLGLPDDTHVCLFFGHLETRKGLQVLIDAAERLQGNGGHHFVIAGGRDANDGSDAYRGALARAARLANVTLLDHRIPFEEVERFFVAADAVALPYLEGTTSGVLKLALAFGVPVVATPVGDFPEQVPQGAGVFIEPGGDVPVALIRGLDALKGDPSYRHCMSSSRDQAQWSDIAAQYLQFLRQ